MNVIQQLWTGPVRRRRAHRIEHLNILHQQKRSYEKKLADLYETIPQIPNLRIRRRLSDEAEDLVALIKTYDNEINQLKRKWKWNP